MKYLERIEKRKSIREFRKRDLEPEVIREIEDRFLKLHRLLPYIDVELQVRTGDTGKRLEGVAGYRGNSFMAPAYLIILSDVDDNYIENAGYIAEDLCLELTDMGISHCWLTADNSDAVKRAALVDSPKEAVVVIACGYGKKEKTRRRLDILNPSNVLFRKREGHVAPKIAQEEMVYMDKWGVPVDWDNKSMDPLLDKAFYAAALAPSFLNRQPYRYILKDRLIILCVKREEMTSDADTLLDLGATMMNFNAVASQQDDIEWTLGAPAGISSLDIPEEYEVAAYYEWD